MFSKTHEDWGIGGAGVACDPSPFPRVNKLRHQYLSTEYSIEAQRAVLVTEAYRANENQPQPIKVARAFAHILQHSSIGIDEMELIVGDCAAMPKACPVFPEFSYEWIIDELQNHPFRSRPNNRYAHTDETDQQLLGLQDYWQGKTVADRILQTLSEDEIKGSTFGSLNVYSLDLCTNGGIGHVVPHFENVYEHGWLGMKRRVQEKLDGLDSNLPADHAKCITYQAQLIVIEAAMGFIMRFADLAREMAVTATGDRCTELQKIAENCEWIAENAPRTLWEALQLGFFITNNVLIESNGHSVSFGRFDQIMFPYLQHDLDAGITSREFAQELIECAMIKCCGMMKLRDWQTTESNSGRGIGGLTLTLGGVDSDGRDASNELSYMCLDALAHTQMSQPWIMVRLHKNSPKALMDKLVCAIKIGMGEPKVVNDQVIVSSMLARGRTLEEARNYSIVGLVEPEVAGCEYSWHDAAYFSIAQVLELALNDGRPLGKPELGQIGPPTGSLADFKTFQELQHAFEQQMDYWVERLVKSVNLMDLAHQTLKPLPYLSLLIDGCIEDGVDVSAGGARYNFSGVQAVGVATVADSLAAIRQLVFTEGKVTGRQLLDALEANWENYDYLYALTNSPKVHHYGNDDDYADELARYAVDVWCRTVQGRPNAHGGVFQPGVFTVSTNVFFGKGQWASADGRKAGEPLSDGISPVHTQFAPHDVKGITAEIKSASKLDQAAASNGVLFNLRIRPSAVQGAHANSNIASLIKSYFSLGGMHLQLSVASREMLEDADRHPEKYRGLLVYVAGYCTLWSELGEELKQDIIARTELNFDGNTDLTPPD